MAQQITARPLESGYYHVRGNGPQNWAQPPRWPCSEETLRGAACPGASEEFIQAALAAMIEGAK